MQPTDRNYQTTFFSIDPSVDIVAISNFKSIFFLHVCM